MKMSKKTKKVICGLVVALLVLFPNHPAFFSGPSKNESSVPEFLADNNAKQQLNVVQNPGSYIKVVAEQSTAANCNYSFGGLPAAGIVQQTGSGLLLTQPASCFEVVAVQPVKDNAVLAVGKLQTSYRIVVNSFSAYIYDWTGASQRSGMPLQSLPEQTMGVFALFLISASVLLLRKKNTKQFNLLKQLSIFQLRVLRC